MRLRKSSIATLTLATAGSFAAASPTLHRHHHVHGDKRNVKVVDVAGPTVVAYELNGQLIDQSEVCEGIQAGTLQWADGSDNSPQCPISTQQNPQSQSTSIVPTPSAVEPSNVAYSAASNQPITPSIANHPSVTPTPFSIQLSKSPAAGISIAPPLTPSVSATIDSSRSSATTPTSFPVPATSSSEPSVSQASSTPGGQGLDAEFPDGEIDCTTFPSNYGPIEVEWANLGGWSGIQYVTIEGDTVTEIVTGVPGGDGCKPGAMCSYACPPGYQKSQWPSAQGSTGQSVGGLSCNSNGKLTLTNPGLSKTLCIPGTGAVIVQNKLSSNAAICRTDYPGTEDETVPLNAEPDSTSPLTCPDASTYFQHDGDPTSAQYYVNNQGIPLQNACLWGTDGSDMGNWAPSYFGVGQDRNGKTWLSIASTTQNDPSSYTPLNYTVKITGDTSGNCGLTNGQYCSGDNYEDCNTEGCTVELLTGQATYVLQDGSSLSD
ncbi:hypothetical protein JMJ35_002067 [Cladonia borealis]|uniref:Uncharacterized protein n=1 Tax=Cladonia borealis TaxID=184061 RepID=A0AA39R724_9LECA|nr:hypothetical protein JMJ35_002067 [Cladonia borealis]